MSTNDYPQLDAMGIRNPRQITRYHVNGVSNHDILRIIYKRNEGSFLPATRTYWFPRVQKTMAAGGDSKRQQTVLESHPDLQKALDDLDRLLENKKQKDSVAETVLEELKSLEDEVAMRSACIRDLVKQL
ncbi:MAG: DUF3461 family protein [Pseudomonadota bacterium]